MGLLYLYLYYDSELKRRTDIQRYVPNILLKVDVAIWTPEYLALLFIPVIFYL